MIFFLFWFQLIMGIEGFTRFITRTMGIMDITVTMDTMDIMATDVSVKQSEE